MVQKCASWSDLMHSRHCQSAFGNFAPAVGDYLDRDGMGYLRKMTGSGADWVKKTIVKHFEELGLRITIDANLRMPSFLLDLTLNLNTSKYQPLRKPNDTPMYINTSSNHLPVILKNLPPFISRRLTDVSSDEEVLIDRRPNECPLKGKCLAQGYCASSRGNLHRRSN